MQSTLLVIAALLLLVWPLVRHSSQCQETQDPVARKAPASTAYHAASITPDNNAC